MSIFRLTLCALAATWLAGCATPPRPDPATAPAQQRLWAVRHWEQLAEQVAFKVAQTQADQPGPALPVFVTGSRLTAFDDAFREYLGARLVAHKVPVATSDIAGGLTLRFDAQVVNHPSGKHEVLITTALQNADAYLMHTADAFDIAPQDAGLYYRTPPSAGVAVKQWQVQ